MSLTLLSWFTSNWSALGSDHLKLHGIFSSNMVLQRDKPIKVWGWAPAGKEVVVSASFSGQPVKAKTDNKKGQWEVHFGAQPANTNPQSITVTAGDQEIVLENILIGDIWVMNGQSNMVWPVEKTLHVDSESAQADMPLLRAFKINNNEQRTMQIDIDEAVIAYEGGWVVSTPESAKQFSAIGFAFASRIQRATGIPIGMIINARGGASIESLAPYRKLREDPLTKRYVEWVDARAESFEPDQWLADRIAGWEKKVAKQRQDGVPENRLAKKPAMADLRSVHIPGKSPSDAGSCYNGMFGVFIGLNIKGVLFHQGYNNAMSTTCLPRRYRILMRLMVEGWREDFNDPALPVGVIGLCAGGSAQNEENFEAFSFSPGSFIRESQRLGLADVGDPDLTAFLPAYDVRIPGLHPRKKREHGVRAARWALSKVYDQEVLWEQASLVSAEPRGDVMVLSFDQPVMPDDLSTVLQGFSIAGEDGKFYRAHARLEFTGSEREWSTKSKGHNAKRVHVWSPLVAQPVAVRYGWSRSPMGNLKINGMPWAPLPSFRTDKWDWPEGDDPANTVFTRSDGYRGFKEAKERLSDRQQRESAIADKVFARLKSLGWVQPQ